MRLVAIEQHEQGIADMDAAGISRSNETGRERRRLPT
jgi:hypothetical protein